MWWSIWVKNTDVSYRHDALEKIFALLSVCHYAVFKRGSEKMQKMWQEVGTGIGLRSGCTEARQAVGMGVRFFGVRQKKSRNQA
jgi:hypothetical protein